MRKVQLILTCILLLMIGVGLSAEVKAQDATIIYRVITTDGNSFIGTIVSEDDQQIVLNTKDLGEITIQRANIKSVEEVDSKRIKGDGEYWFENPHGTRYLFSTSAIGLKKGEGYYQNVWIFFNNVNYGFSNNISMGAGLIPTFLFGGATPVWLLPKVSVPIAKDNIHLAAGGMFGGVVGDGESFGIGLAYGAITVGNLDQNLTFAVGFGYGDGQWSDIPLFNINGMIRLTRTIYLISENYIISAGGETAGFLSGAVRWAPENLALDFGLFRPYIVGENIDGGFIGIPWLGATIPFGN